MPTNEQTTNNTPEKSVISFQVNSKQKEYFELFKDKYGYQTTSNAVKVHLKVASKIFENSPEKFFECLDASNF